MTIGFKGSHYPKEIILHAVFFYVRNAVSYRDLEAIMAERGAEVDHATQNRWVIKFSALIAMEAHNRKQKTGVFWRMDETYIKVKGFKSFGSAFSTLEGLDVAHMIRKRQFDPSGQSASQQFAALAG